ncbi:MAG: hypothetical protein ACI93L_003024 [Cyclobacteriaceae bacterium]|jgi:hypothetical protein
MTPISDLKKIRYKEMYGRIILYVFCNMPKENIPLLRFFLKTF